jgi:hypothetical protein
VTVVVTSMMTMIMMIEPRTGPLVSLVRDPESLPDMLGPEDC